MSNMGYCRFENTARDLQDCYEHFGDNDLSETETAAREAIVLLCLDIVADID